MAKAKGKLKRCRKCHKVVKRCQTAFATLYWC